MSEPIAFAGKINNAGEYSVIYWAFGGEATPLPLYLNEVNHSPDGFCWGYHGSGPAQLAYAILRKWLELRGKIHGEVFARALYQRFKSDVIAKWDMKLGFTLRDEYIDVWWRVNHIHAEQYVNDWIRENSQTA